ncbi:MAG: hypothetical protein R2851_20210 [Caldilineaceae bacterium]
MWSCHPQVDNERASVLRTEIGQHNAAVEWVAVRPDGLTDGAVTDYRLFPSPIRSPHLQPGQDEPHPALAHFIAELIDNDRLWQNWRGQMPAVYSAASRKEV